MKKNKYKILTFIAILISLNTFCQSNVSIILTPDKNYSNDKLFQGIKNEFDTSTIGIGFDCYFNKNVLIVINDSIKYSGHFSDSIWNPSSTMPIVSFSFKKRHPHNLLIIKDSTGGILLKQKVRNDYHYVNIESRDGKKWNVRYSNNVESRD